MPDILLVLGDATAAMYAPLKRAMTKMAGRVPKVIQVPWDHATTVPFVDGAYDEFVVRHPQDTGKVTRAEARFMLERPDQLEEVYINELFGQSNLVDVMAILYGLRIDEDEGAYRAPYPPFGWLTRRIPHEIATYSVQTSESKDGTSYLVGSGFGDLRNPPQVDDR